MKCKYFNCNNDVVLEQGGRKKQFCSPRCKNIFHVGKRRWKLKIQAVTYKGGKCSQCGYNECIAALEFHHIDPTTKTFSVSSKPHTRSWKRIKEEVDKCELLCANCHRKFEYNKYISNKSFMEEFNVQL